MKLFPYLLFASLIIFSASCTKDDNDDGVNYGVPPKDTITIDSAWQFSMDVDDSTVVGVLDDTSVIGEWLNIDSLNTAPDTSFRNFNSTLADANTFTPIFDVFHNGFKFVDFPEDSLVEQFFATGTYNYSTFYQPGFS